MKKCLPLILTALILLLTACGYSEAQPPENPDVELTAEDFTDGNHKRSGEYLAAFKTRSAALEGIKLHFAESLFDENTSPEMGESIAESYYALRALAVEWAKETEVYIVVTTTSGGPVLIGQKLYVSPEMVESGEYLPWLAAAVYGIEDYWICVGLGMTALCAEEVDSSLASDIEEFFAVKPDSQILSLHPCFFLDDFADADTRNLAERMAKSLAGYILSEHGFAAFMDRGGDAELRRAWLGSLGLDYELACLESEGAEYVSRMDFSVTGDVPMVLKGEDFGLNIKCVDWLPDAESVYSFLLDFGSGAAEFYARLAEEAPEFYAALKEDTGLTAVQFRPSDYPISSRASMLKSEAVVTDDADVLHEICHTLMPRAAIDEAYWLCEGLVTYLTAPYVSYRADSIVVDSVLMEYEGDTEEDRALRAETVRCFEELNGCEITEVYDMEQPIYKIYEATGYAAFLNPDNNSAPVATQSIKDNYSERHGNSIKGNYPGNELSYLKAMLFTQWLVDKYGLETVIAAEMYKHSYFELFPDAAAFETEFAEFWAARVEHLAE